MLNVSSGRLTKLHQYSQWGLVRCLVRLDKEDSAIAAKSLPAANAGCSQSVHEELATHHHSSVPQEGALKDMYQESCSDYMC